MNFRVTALPSLYFFILAKDVTVVPYFRSLRKLLIARQLSLPPSIYFHKLEHQSEVERERPRDLSKSPLVCATVTVLETFLSPLGITSGLFSKMAQPEN